ncbi:hypothetical protein HRbin27_01181 [bacterium HR27]|nr:hypothetical protein HRbin27_01181 [bacterium HR27]
MGCGQGARRGAQGGDVRRDDPEDGPAAGREGSHPATPANSVPDRPASLLALHPGDGRADLRDAERAVPQGSRDAGREFRPGAHDDLRLRDGLDAAHLRRAEHRLRGAPAAADGQHGPAGWRHPGLARPRDDPGLDRYSDALPLDPGIHGPPGRAAHTRYAARLHPHRDTADRVLGEPAQVHGELLEVDVRRCRQAGERLRLRLAPEDQRRLLVHGELPRHGAGRDQGCLLLRAEPGNVDQRRPHPTSTRQSGLAGRQGQLRDGDGRVLVQVARSPERRDEARGNQDRGLLVPVSAGGGNRGDVH